MSSLQLYAYNGLEVRTQLIDGEPWFVLGDLCKVLGIANPSDVVARLDSEYLDKTEVLDGRGILRETNIVNESGMYEVVIRSNGIVAKPFRKWIVNDVLPSIRRTGSYGVAAPTGPALLALAVVEAQQMLAAKDERIAELEPKAAQADLSRDAEGHETIGDLANRIQLWAASNHPSVKVLHRDVFDLAGELNVIIRGNTVRNNQPTSQAIKANWVRVKETVVETKSHGNKLVTSIRLTPRGAARIWDAAILRITTAQPLTTQKELV